MLLIPLHHSLQRLPLMLQFPQDCQDSHLKPTMQRLPHRMSRCSTIPWLFQLILDMLPTNMRTCKPASLSCIHNILHNRLIQTHTPLQVLRPLPLPLPHRDLGVRLILNSSIRRSLRRINYHHPLHHNNNMHNIRHTCFLTINNRRYPLLLLTWCSIIIINLLIKILILLYNTIHFNNHLRNNNFSHNSSNYPLLELLLLFQQLLIPVVRMLSTNQNATPQLATIH